MRTTLLELCTFIAILFLSAAYGVEKVTFIECDDDIQCVSPNHQWQCLIKHADNSRGLANNAVIFKSSKDSVILWSYERHVDLSWTSDSRYVIIHDTFFDKSAIVIFKITNKKPELIYQTPYSDSVLDYYRVDLYRNGSVHVICTDETGDKVKLIYERWVVLNDGFLGIKQNIYSDEFEKANSHVDLKHL